MDGLVSISAQQLRVWARNIRQAVDDLYPAHRVAADDQRFAALPEDAGVAELAAAGSYAKNAKDNLLMIAGDLEERAEYGRHDG